MKAHKNEGLELEDLLGRKTKMKNIQSKSNFSTMYLQKEKVSLDLLQKNQRNMMVLLQVQMKMDQMFKVMNISNL